MTPSCEIDRLLDIMRALRTPETGCSWDLVQTFESIVSFTIEEAYEVADAVERGDLADLKDELGDLLLQVVFHAQIADEQGAFTFADVVDAIAAKMIRRHPHVFGEPRIQRTPAETKRIWAEIKAAEKAERAERVGTPPERHLHGVPANHPALMRAIKLQAKAATVGFDWNDVDLVMDKIREETEEVRDALSTKNKAAVEDEIGDLLFAVVNLARHAGVDPEAALRGSNAKFERRFAHIEDRLTKQGKTLAATDLPDMEALWVEAKLLERQHP